jgi:hypothetical protein
MTMRMLSTYGRSARSIALAVCLAAGAAHCGSESDDNTNVPAGGDQDAGNQDAGDASDAAADGALPVSPAVGLVAIPPGYDTSEAGCRTIVDAGLRAQVDLLYFGYAQWASIEKSPGTFDFSEFDGWLAAIDQQPFAYAMDVATPIAPFGLDVPEDLAMSSWDDPHLRSRYAAFLQASVAFAPAGTRYVTLHVEGATEYFGEHPAERDGFCEFMSEAVNVIHDARPDLLVGVYWRYEDQDASLRECVTGAADYLGLAFVLNPPGDSLDDIPVILNAYLEDTTKPVAIVEAGWPSADRFSSSDAIQAEFVQRLFAAVEGRGDRIPFISYYTVFDEDRDVATAWVNTFYPSLPEDARQALIDWVCSLGLLRSDGSEKPSWEVFTSAIEAARGTER